MGRKKLTTEDIKERIYSLEGDNYELLSEYVDARTKIRVKHRLCGYQYETLWGSFHQGHRCPKCSGLKKLTTEDIKERIYSIEGNEYELLSDYVNARTKIKIKHVACGHQYETLWSSFQQGKRCPKCAMLARKNKLAFTNEDIVKVMYKLVGNEYTKMDDTYINAHTKFKIKHNTCKHEFEVNWNNFQSGKRCPRCNQPKGEKFIADYLTNHNISFATQVRFADCRHKLPLSFDFAIIDNEKIVKALIEYDGEQHYKPVKAWGGEENLKVVQLRDSIKNEYCAKHKIPLLRIRFDEDIEEKLNFFLYKLKGPKSQREMEEAPTT